MVEFTRFDVEGVPLLRKLFPLREYEGGILSRERSRLFTLIGGNPGRGYAGKRESLFSWCIR